MGLQFMARDLFARVLVARVLFILADAAICKTHRGQGYVYICEVKALDAFIRCYSQSLTQPSTGRREESDVI